MRSNRTLVALLAALLGFILAGGQARAGDLFGNDNEDEEVWAIRCATARGPDRVRTAKGTADVLKKVRGLDAKLVLVIDEQNESIVYYGRYKRTFDKSQKTDRFKPEPTKDLDLIRSLNVQGTEQWPFVMATMEPLPGASKANPAWNLENADGYYSLHIAVFYNVGEFRSRKFAAEEYCKQLRAEGQEAFYHHGPVNSSVTIGLFPKEAISTFEEVDRKANVTTVKSKIVDPRLLALQKKYPMSLQNGYKAAEVTRNPRTNEVVSREPTPSFAVLTPKGEKLQAAGNLPKVRKDGPKNPPPGW